MMEIFFSVFSGLLLGIIVGPLIFKGFIKSSFSDTARSVLNEVTEKEKEKSEGELSEAHKELKVELKELNKTVHAAQSVWSTSTKSLSEQVESLSKSHTQWETALKNTKAQGNLGEEALEEIIKDIGLVEHIHYKKQKNNGDRLNDQIPDFYITWADGTKVVIDSKVTVTNFTKSVKTDDPELKKTFLKNHAEDVWSHVKSLGGKKYYEALKGSPDFTVMYLHNDHLYLHAIDQDENLIEKARKRNVLILPPTLVYGFLKMVKLAHFQKDIEKNAEQTAKIGNEIHQRLSKFIEYFDKVGNGLSTAVKRYNDAFNSWQGRLIPKLNELERIQGTNNSEKLDEKLKPIEIAPIVGSNESLKSDEKLVNIESKVKK